MSISTLDSKLQGRGLLEAARRMGWDSAKGGWSYPVYDTDGQIVARRFKNADSKASPKYYWSDGKAEYYHLPEIISAIAAAGGVLIVANGEPGVLTFHAAGVENVLCVFGESNLPDDAGALFRSWGVTHVEYYPDLDAPMTLKNGTIKPPEGLSAARKWNDALQAVGITFNAYDLSVHGLPEKGDTNDLWQIVGFAPDSFKTALRACPLAALPEVENKPVRDDDYEPIGDDFPASFVSAVVAAIENQAGFKRWRGAEASICSPFRDEKNASFGFNREKLTGYDYATGQGYGVIEIGRELGINIVDHQPVRMTRKRPGRPKGVKAAKPQALPVALPAFTADETVNVRYVSELDAGQYLKHEALLIKSPINSGKTAFVNGYYTALGQLLGREPRVLAITHRRALAGDLSARLTAETGAAFENYRHMNRGDLPRANRLVICYNSLVKLAPYVGSRLPEYDVILIDELQQFNAHLEGETMRGGEAMQCYTYLRQLMTSADRFIGLDAHMSDVSAAWVRNIVGDVWCVENKAEFDRGRLVLHSDETTIIETALKVAGDSTAPIAIACTSKASSEAAAELFRQRFGDDRVKLVNGDNSEDRETQAFIAAINTRLSDFKVLIYTTSLGTGVDITAPVAAVFGLFTRVNGLSAYDHHQLLARCRNADVRHVYAQDCEGRREANAERIYRRHVRNAWQTGQACDFDAHGIVALTPALEHAAWLLARLEAERNAALNAPLAYFVALATGYTLEYQDGKNGAVAAQIKTARETVKEREKTAVLAAPVVTDEELQAARDNGELTPEHRAGNAAYKILNTVGRDELTERLYDDLHTTDQRRKLRTFTNLDENVESIKELDRAEAAAGVILSRLHHHTLTRALILGAFTAVWGADWRTGAAEGLTSADIESRLTPYLDEHHEALYDFLGRRRDKSKQVLPLLRWIMGQVGLKLDRKQIMRDGERFYVYQIDPATLGKMDDYAATRRAQLDRKRAERALKAQNGNLPDYFIPVFKYSTGETDVNLSVWASSRQANFAALAGV